MVARETQRGLHRHRHRRIVRIPVAGGDSAQHSDRLLHAPARRAMNAVNQLFTLLLTFGMLSLFAIGTTVTVSVLSGLYPSLVVSSFRPVLALKNQVNNRSSSGYFLRRLPDEKTCRENNTGRAG